MSNLPEKKQLPVEAQVLDILSIEVANHILKGLNKSQISVAMGYNRRQIQRLIARPAFETYLKDVDKYARSIATTYVRNSVAGIAPKIVKALERLLEKDNPKGVELALRTLGAMEQNPDADKHPGTIQVFLPGAAPAKDVQAEVVDVTGPVEQTKTAD